MPDLHGVRCPDCRGAGARYGGHILHMADGSSRIEHVWPCSRCSGSGTVPVEMLDWIPRGERARKLRMEMDLSQREAAKHVSMSVVEVSQYEHGRADPSLYLGYIEKMWSMFRQEEEDFDGRADAQSD